MSELVGGARGPTPVESRRDGRARLPVAQPSATLSSLRPGDTVTGVVASVTEDGRTLIDTRHGRLALAGLPSLVKGQTVRFEVVAAGDRVELVLLPPKTEPPAPPPPSRLTAAPQGSARLPSGAPIAVVDEPPVALTSLRPGDTVTGTVAGAAENGRTLVDTRYGQLALAGLSGLVKGQAVRFEVVTAGDRVELALLPRKAELLERGAVFSARLASVLQAPAGQPSGALIAVAEAPPALRALAVGALIEGTLTIENGTPVLTGAFGRVTLAATPGAVTPGLARFAVVDNGAQFTLAADALQPTAGGLAASLKAPLQLALARLIPGYDTMQQHAEGVTLSVRVLAVAPPGSPIEGGAGSLIGTVGDTQGGVVRITTPAGVLTLPVARAPQPGTKVAFQILDQPGAMAPLMPEDLRAQSINNLAKAWPALGESLRALTALDPTAAAALSAGLPTPGATLLTGMAAFLSALFGGRMPQWLGEARRALDRHGQVSLAQRLSADAAELPRFADNGAAGEWRAAFVPLLDQGAPTQVRLFLHGPRRRKGEKESPAGTRFLVEADLSRLGPLQLDGLVHKSRFELIVRTMRPLDPALQREIEEICASARAAGGWSGGQVFQVTERFPVMPLSATSGHAIGVYA